ncbi:MAG: flagellar motor protein, partial [Myxococcaceae bacterium]
DPRTLPPGKWQGATSITVELPPGGLAAQDFAFSAPTVASVPIQRSVGAADRQGGALRYQLSGRAPGAVFVEGAPADVDAQGIFRAWVTVRRGRNDLSIRSVAPDGAVQLFVQRLDVIERQGSILFIPREPRTMATLRLPPGEADAGAGTVRITAPPGATVALKDVARQVPSTGVVDVPVVFSPGANTLGLKVIVPGQTAVELSLEVQARARPFAVGLLEVELGFSPSTRGFSFFGRGAGFGELRLGAWDLRANIDLQDQDLKAGPLWAPRAPERLFRWLDPDQVPSAWADDSVGGAVNAGEGRIQIEASHPTYGAVGFGNHRAQHMDVDVGRYRRSLFGGYADLHLPAGAASAGISAFAAPSSGDPSRGLALRPAHDEYLATGGSLFWLGQVAVATGTESVRVELRDGLTGLPLEERILTRGRDYEIDYPSGRIILARPLSFVGPEGRFRADAPGGAVEPVLVVDYEHLNLGDASGSILGAEVKGNLGPVQLGAGITRDTGFQLLAGRGRVPFRGYLLTAEVAQSRGRAVDAFGVSENGGITWVRPAADDTSLGNALSVRLKGPNVDVGFRRRSPGFSDTTHWDAAGLRQFFVRLQHDFGGLRVGGLLDDRATADPRDPFTLAAPVRSRVAGGWLGYRAKTWDVRLEAKDSQLAASPLLGDPIADGSRTSIALSARYHLLNPLWLRAGHKQVVSVRGAGLGAFNDSCSSLGAEWAMDATSKVGLTAGYGPSVGWVLLGGVEVQRGADTYYGSYTADVDAPDLSNRGPRSITGARTDVAEGTTVFVEDVGAREERALRVSRAVGLTQNVGGNLSVSARYERGVRGPLDAAPTLARDAGSASLSWARARIRAFARAEIRYERGQTLLLPPAAIDRVSRLGTLSAEFDATSTLALNARVHYADSVELKQTRARLLEAFASGTWRFSRGALVLQYSFTRELRPDALAERSLQRVSALPAFRFGGRFALASGLHLGHSNEANSPLLILVGSLRPSVRVVGGLEVAAEVAGRTWRELGGSWHAVRGEVGYRFQESLLVAAGYHVTGFTGLGLLNGATASQDRVYLRAEVAY